MDKEAVKLPPAPGNAFSRGAIYWPELKNEKDGGRREILVKAANK
jgi:hypothetical protein